MHDSGSGTEHADSIDGLDGNDQIAGAGGNDFIYGSAGNDVLKGGAGNDRLDGGVGYDLASYADATGGIAVSMAAGSVTGDATVGVDALISVEGVRGTAFVDTYNAAGFGAGSPNAGSLGTFNEFTGGGGDDLITGNGATRLSYNNARRTRGRSSRCRG